MADDPKKGDKPAEAAAPAAKATIADVRAHQAEMQKVRELVELDQRKINASKLKRERWELKRRANPDDADEFDEWPPLYEGDAALHERYHAMHYQAAELEKQAGIWKGGTTSK